MLYIDTRSTDIYNNLAAEYYFAAEHPFDDDVFMLWHNTPTLVIGKYQNTLEEIDAAYARERGINVCRRLSGGGTVYQDEGCWQFSFITRSNGIEIEFERFLHPITEALAALGVNAVPNGRNDITLGGRKVSGNSQYKLGGMTIHHGTLLFDTNINELVRATTPKEYKITSKAIKSVRDRVTNIREHLPRDMSGEEFRAHIVSHVADEEYAITPDDRAQIEAIADRYFRSPEAIYSRSPRFEIEKNFRTDGGEITIGLTVRHGVIENAGITGDFFSGVNDPGEALIGIKYTPDAVRDALDGKIYKIGTDEIVRALFE